MHLNKILFAQQYITRLWCSALSLTVKKDQITGHVLNLFACQFTFIGKNPWILQ